MKTQRERLIEALKLRGSVEVPSRTVRYVTLTRPTGGFYFVGRAGALRYGTASSRSYAAQERFREELLASVPAKEVSH